MTKETNSQPSEDSQRLDIRNLRKVLLPTLVCIALFSLKCKDAGVQPPDNTFVLTVNDASCTEIYLNLKIGTGITSRMVILKRDTITLFTKTIDATETTITDTSLLPGHTYNYIASLSDGVNAHTQATTMDTTSHAWTFTTTLLGDGSGSSTLYDVAIVGDTIWAVGEIFSGGKTYNYAIWNGNAWILGVTSDTGYGYGALYCIYAFAPNDIWVGSSILEHWDGTKWTFYGSTRGYQNAFAIRKIWGTSSSNSYFVGDGGNIRYYNGSSWTKIESGMSTTIQDVYGSIDSQTGKRNILCAVSAAYSSTGSEILSIDENNNASTVPWVSNRSAYSVWFRNISRVFACGSGVLSRGPDLRWKEIAGTTVMNAFTNHIRGQGNNDIVVVSDFGDIAHFNGIDFQLFPNVTSALGSPELFSCDMKNNTIIAVGFTSSYAVIAVGKR